MKSSWAGAMGLTQFLPSDYFNFAVDFDGDGRRRHLEFGAGRARFRGKATRRQGLAAWPAWAYEVHAPANVDCTIGVPENTQPIGEWLKRGFVPTYGRTSVAG